MKINKNIHIERKTKPTHISKNIFIVIESEQSVCKTNKSEHFAMSDWILTNKTSK
jgi:hypothetical protein